MGFVQFFNDNMMIKHQMFRTNTIFWKVGGERMENICTYTWKWYKKNAGKCWKQLGDDPPQGGNDLWVDHLGTYKSQLCQFNPQSHYCWVFHHSCSLLDTFFAMISSLNVFLDKLSCSNPGQILVLMISQSSDRFQGKKCYRKPSGLMVNFTMGFR